MHSTIALASASPRRRELLQQLGVTFELVTPDIDESILTAELAATYVSRLALTKAQIGLQLLAGRLPVLGADTSVVIDGCILGKPESEADFLHMMQRLSGRSHQVMTAVALVTPTQQWQILVTTEVWFRSISQQEMADYWQSGEPVDKAGGYGIQGQAGKFVERINGSYSAVVGLPLCETDLLLQKLQRSR
ncbi:Maf-like protein [Alishewanella longhuensis]|uniref:dTTP/UTP pyrophosphatase n=1 Tax=Alishewanella longhuensis TaxID=1091037 RepID=A0ABQ3L4C7_9ALTE|nr:Maf family protein [Alishewanella longhuensis]GHG72964.1 Maf-like protein [Alishewanella longhuensis]